MKLSLVHVVLVIMLMVVDLTRWSTRSRPIDRCSFDGVPFFYSSHSGSVASLRREGAVDTSLHGMEKDDCTDQR